MKMRVVVGVTLVLLVCAAFAYAASIHSAAAKGDIDEVKSLLKANANLVNSMDKDGAIAVHHAAAKGNKAIVQLLIENKADVNAKKKDGVTPLHVASALGKKDVVELLLANKADVYAKDKNGRTPLSLAQTNKHKEVAKILIDFAKTNPPAAAASNAPAPSAPDQPASSSTNITSIAQEVVRNLESGNFGSVVSKFDSKLKQALPESKVRETWSMVISQAGPLIRHSEARLENIQGIQRAVIVLEFRKGKLEAQVAFNSANEIIGFGIINPEALKNAK